MRAPSTTLLRVITALVLLPMVGCPVEPEPDPPTAQLSVSSDKNNVNVGEAAIITVTSTKADQSAGTGDITGTINTESDTRASATLQRDGDNGGGGDTATAGADSDGKAKFALTCNSVGTAKVDFVNNDLKASSTVNCVDKKRDITVDVTDCTLGNKLQADGFSSCRIVVAVDQAPENTKLKVTFGEVTDAAGAVVDAPAALRKDLADVGALVLADVTVDASGRGSFFIANVTKEFTLPLVVTDSGNNRATAVVKVGAVENRMALKLESAAKVPASSTSSFTLTGTNPNGSIAAGRAVAVSITTADATLVNGDCLVDGTATLDAAGKCVFGVAVGDDLTTRAVTVKGVFELSAALTVETSRTAEVTPIGALQVEINPNTITITPEGATPISTDPQFEAAVTVKVKKGSASDPEAAHDNVTVTVTVAGASIALVKLKSAQDVAPAAFSSTTFTITNPNDGIVSFVVDAAGARALGSAIIDVVVQDNDVGGTRDSQSINIKVERKLELSQIVFQAFNPADGQVIGVPGGSLPTSTGVVFRLLNEQNLPVANELVRFAALSSVPGINVIPDALSGADGTVSTVVSAGTVASPITVRATVASNPLLFADSRSIGVVGGLPNSATSAFKCDTKAAFSPFDTDCVAQLNDRFTNVVTTPLNVQFRAEGGNIPATVAAAGGLAAGNYAFSEPGPGSADVLEWSHSVVRPTSATSTLRAAFPGCFDATNRSTCDLLAICTSTNSAINVFCPLAPSTLSPDSVLCINDISDDALDALNIGGNPLTFADWELEAFTDANSTAATQLLAYDDEHRACGLPLSCLEGNLGLGLIGDTADNCPVNAGCLDFTTATECPQAGLLDILAAVRGEEAFDDANGNGVHDDAESFIDYPEPFLDKNSSCSFDDVNGLARLTSNEKVRLSDLFIDGDRDGKFGFGTNVAQNIAGTETNDRHDANTEIFLKTSVVLLQGRLLQFGEPVAANLCGANGAAVVACRSTDTGSALARTSTCTENALSHLGGEALLGSCRPVASEFRDNDVVNMVFRWTDSNGNCPTADFAGAPSITVDGPAKVFFDDAAYDDSQCGASPGSVNASNSARPWCEEHTGMGSRLRRVQIQADCGGLTGVQPVKLTFSLDGTNVTQFVSVGCPVCGDNIVEGDEECDETSATCDPVACTRIAP